MLNTFKNSKILLALLLASSIAACSSNSNTDELQPVDGSLDNTSENYDPNFTNSSLDTGNQNDTIYAGYSQNQLQTENNTVYFGFNQYQPLAQYLPLIQAQANFLVTSGAKVVLKGYTDERGTPAYNIVLGAKRAADIAKLLESYGVKPSQIRQLSYGESDPAVLGHTESDYAQNRRVVFYYKF